MDCFYQWKANGERIIALWLVASFRLRIAQLVSSPFMIDKCPLCLDYNCKSAEYMTTASVCWWHNGIFCPWQQGCTFVWLFGGKGCTPPPPCWCWNGHFVFVYLMAAVKLQGRDKGNCPIEQQQQLSIYLLIHVFLVHQPPDANCVVENMCSVWIWENLDWSISPLPVMSVIHACICMILGFSQTTR